MRRKEGLNEQPNPYGVNMSKTKMSIATLNTNTPSKSSADIVQESIGAGMDAAGGIWLVFRGSEGKGTGQQQVRGSELAELIDAVRDTVENGINDDEENLSAAEMFRRTFALREAPEGKTGQYCTFRLNNGKGAKPVTIPFDELGSSRSPSRTRWKSRSRRRRQRSCSCSSPRRLRSGWWERRPRR